QRRPPPPRAPRPLLVLALDLRPPDAQRLEVAGEPVRLAAGGLEVLVTGEAHRFLALHRGSETGLPSAQGTELGFQRLQFRPTALDLGRGGRDLVAQLADGALAAEDRVILRLAVAV